MSETEKMNNQYCGFKIGKGYYAIPVLSVQEVVKPQTVTPVPLSQEHIRGLINLRGQIVTSVSIRKLFGLDEDLSSDHMNIIVRGDDSLISFVVDEILDVFEVDEKTLEKTPDTLDPKLKNFVKKVCKLEENLVVLLDIERLINF